MEKENFEKKESAKEGAIVDDLQKKISKSDEISGVTDQQETNRIVENIKREPLKIRKIKSTRILKAIFLFIISLLAWFIIVQYVVADKYEAVVQVVEKGGKVGVNPMTERLDYGDLPKGNASTRFIMIENSGSLDVYVKVVKYGGIAELIKINENNFTLNPGEKERLELLLEMPISANKEGYEGKVIIFKLPKVF